MVFRVHISPYTLIGVDSTSWNSITISVGAFIASWTKSSARSIKFWRIWWSEWTMRGEFGLLLSDYYTLALGLLHGSLLKVNSFWSEYFNGDVSFGLLYVGWRQICLLVVMIKLVSQYFFISTLIPRLSLCESHLLLWTCIPGQLLLSCLNFDWMVDRADHLREDLCRELDTSQCILKEISHSILCRVRDGWSWP